MSEPWFNFAIVIASQIVLFLVVAIFEKKLVQIPNILKWGIPIGLVIGLLFDLIIGKYLGINSYVLGFGLPFLLINGAVSYGLFAATVFLFKDKHVWSFTGWIVALTLWYELTNYFFPVWKWEFALPAIPFFLVLILGYWWGAMNVALIHHFLLKKKFAIFNKTILR